MQGERLWRLIQNCKMPYIETSKRSNKDIARIPRGLAGALESLYGALMTMALVNVMSDKYDDNNRGLNAAIYEMARLGVSLVALTLTEKEKS